MATKTTKRLTGTEYKTARALAQKNAGYSPTYQGLIAGLNTETIAQQAYDHLLVGNLDAAKDLIQALRTREAANRLTFHP